MKLAIPFLLILAGCASQARDQAAADALAGIDAMAQVAPATAPIASGASDHVLATRGVRDRSELPAPQMQPAAIVAAPEDYQAQGKQAIEDSAGWGVLAGIGSALVLALGVARQLGVGGPLVGIAEWVLTSGRQRAQEAAKQARQGDLAGAAVSIIGAIESAPAAVAKPVKKAVSKVVTPEQEAAIRRVLQDMSLAPKA